MDDRGAQSFAGDHQTGPAGLDSAPRLVGFQLELRAAQAALSRDKRRPGGLGQGVCQLGGVPAAYREPGRPAGHTRAAIELEDAGEETPDRVPQGCAQPVTELVYPAEKLVQARDHDLGRGRGGRGADVGHQVADRHVDLVTNRGDHRDRGRRDRPGDRFLVEGPQVLERPAAPPDDDDIDPFLSRELVDAARDLSGSALSLHAHWADDDVGCGMPPGQHLENVL